MVIFLILIPSTGLWKAELTDRMTEQTQNSWNGDVVELFSRRGGGDGGVGVGGLHQPKHTLDNLIIPLGNTHSKLIYLNHCHHPSLSLIFLVFILTHVRGVCGGRQWFYRYPWKILTSWHATPLRYQCLVKLFFLFFFFFVNGLATTGPGSCISGWHLYKKLYRNTCKNRGESNNYQTKKKTNKKNADVFIKSSMSSNTYNTYIFLFVLFFCLFVFFYSKNGWGAVIVCIIYTTGYKTPLCHSPESTYRCGCTVYKHMYCNKIILRAWLPNDHCWDILSPVRKLSPLSSHDVKTKASEIRTGTMDIFLF